jgi:hypothetical protein
MLDKAEKADNKKRSIRVDSEHLMKSKIGKQLAVVNAMIGKTLSQRV